MLYQFHLADFKCYTHPLEQGPFRIKHFITYVTSHQSEHGNKKNSNKPVDPSNFLGALKRKLLNLTQVPFDFNTQQDVVEILQVVLDELKGVSLASRQLISNTRKISFFVIPGFVPLSQKKIFIIIIIVRVMCMSVHFCNTWLFSNSSFSVLCSKNFEVMKLAATRYDETNVDIHPFLILNMEKPKILSGIFFGDNKNSLYKLFLQTIIT